MKYSQKPSGPRACLAVAVVGAILLTLAPSDRSLWIDEGYSARMIMAPGSLLQCWQMILQDHYGMPQFFGHSLAGFMLGGVFGYTEYALRMANLVWAFAGIAAFAFAGRKLGIPWLPLVFAANPFVWFYVDEVRPYAMQLAAGSWMMVSFVFVISTDSSPRSRTLWTNIFWFSCFVACAASALGAISVAATVSVAFVALLFLKNVSRRGVWISSGIWILALSGLMGFHAYFIFVEGNAGSQLWTPGIMNAAFAIYEMSGLMGWGPSRETIRAAAKEGGFAGLIQCFIPYLSSLTAYSAVLLIAAYGVLKKSACHNSARVHPIWLAAVFFLGLVLMLSAASLANWPFWGRHVSPLFPFGAVAVALGFSQIGLAGRIGAAIWIALMVFSSIQGRFFQASDTDDYRSASRIAAEYISNGQVVWWSADPTTPNYYHIHPTHTFKHQKTTEFHTAGQSAWPRLETNGTANCYSVLYLSRSELEQLPFPYIVITSKPDMWDTSGELHKFLAKKNFLVFESFPGFQIWKKP